MATNEVDPPLDNLDGKRCLFGETVSGHSKSGLCWKTSNVKPTWEDGSWGKDGAPVGGYLSCRQRQLHAALRYCPVLVRGWIDQTISLSSGCPYCDQGARPMGPSFPPVILLRQPQIHLSSLGQSAPRDPRRLLLRECSSVI